MGKSESIVKIHQKLPFSYGVYTKSKKYLPGPSMSAVIFSYVSEVDGTSQIPKKSC